MLHVQIQIVFLYYNLYLNTIIHLVGRPCRQHHCLGKTFRTGITKRNNNTHSLFQINLLTVQALITEGNISLPSGKANQIYQKAREMDYPLGTALALHAIGNTYLSSSTPQVAIKSYKEAIRNHSETPSCQTNISKTILSQFILTKLSSTITK